MAAVVMDAIRNPQKLRPDDECVVGEAARQFWERSMLYASESSRRRFIETFDNYTASVVQQAHDRAENHIRGIDDYFVVRRDTIGARPSFVVLTFALNLPDEVFVDPMIQKVTNACIDMLILGNDLCSYNVEQARGDDSHNIITIVMHQKKIGLHDAMNWISEYHSMLEKDFMDGINSIPSFKHALDNELKRYVDGLGNWVRANDCWSFESQKILCYGWLADSAK
ncbi:hypothetical protein C0991_008616 [Blastosporella zonata]|nr:hypothetical protein C0991_008616 [Blastosporella zonata]